MCINRIAKRNSRGEMEYVPCGRCYQCVRKRKFEWEQRLAAASDWSDCAFFKLLSYDDEHYDFDISDFNIRKSHIQLMLKRLRRYIEYHYGKGIKIKYFIASELGERKDRLHYHACFFAKGIKWTWLEFNSLLRSYRVRDRLDKKYILVDPLQIAPYKNNTESVNGKPRYTITPPIWHYGYVGNCYNLKTSPKRISYTVKYIQKQYNTKYYSRFEQKEVCPEASEHIRSYESKWQSSETREDIPLRGFRGKPTPYPSYWVKQVLSPFAWYAYRDVLRIIAEDKYDYNKVLRKQCNFENKDGRDMKPYIPSRQRHDDILSNIEFNGEI